MNVCEGKFVYEKSDRRVHQDFVKLENLRPEQMIENNADWEVQLDVQLLTRCIFSGLCEAGQLLSERMHWRYRVRTSTVWNKSGQEVLDRFNKDSDFFKNALHRIERVTKNRKFKTK